MITLTRIKEILAKYGYGAAEIDDIVLTPSRKAYFEDLRETYHWLMDDPLVFMPASSEADSRIFATWSGYGKTRNEDWYGLTISAWAGATEQDIEKLIRKLPPVENQVDKAVLYGAV